MLGIEASPNGKLAGRLWRDHAQYLDRRDGSSNKLECERRGGGDNTLRVLFVFHVGSRMSKTLVLIVRAVKRSEES